MNHTNQFQLRPPIQADIPALVHLSNLCWRELTGNEDTTEASLRSAWETPGFDPASDCCVVTAAKHGPENGPETEGKDELIGTASIFTRAPYVYHYVGVQVHPGYRGQGIGSALTEWTEKRARQRLSAAPPDAQVNIASNIPSSHHWAAQLLQEQGYRLTRSFHEMDIVMSEPPPAPTWPDGITIRPFDPDQDRVAAYLAHQDSFRDHYGFVAAPFDEDFPRWWHHITEHPHYDPSAFFLAMDQDEIAGFVFCYAQDYEIADMAWVENVGVRRAWRRRGLAHALLYHTFGEMYERGQKRVGLGVDADSLTGATRLYEKAGMRTFRQFDRYDKELRAGKRLTTQQVDG